MGRLTGPISALALADAAQPPLTPTGRAADGRRPLPESLVGRETDVNVRTVT
jgi:hypothetical protein